MKNYVFGFWGTRVYRSGTSLCMLLLSLNESINFLSYWIIVLRSSVGNFLLVLKNNILSADGFVCYLELVWKAVAGNGWGVTNSNTNHFKTHSYFAWNSEYRSCKHFSVYFTYRNTLQHRSADIGFLSFVMKLSLLFT